MKALELVQLIGPYHPFFSIYYRIYTKSLQSDDVKIELMDHYLHFIQKSWRSIHTTYIGLKYPKCGYHDLISTVDPNLMMQVSIN